MRYVGQHSEITVQLAVPPGADEYLDAFHAAHRQRFSHANEEVPVEIVNLRLTTVGHAVKPEIIKSPLGVPNPQAAHIGYKQVQLAETVKHGASRPFLAAMYQREKLGPGNIIVGPAVVFELDSTSVIPPGWAARVDGWGNLVVEVQG
jgi:N-methylhydantoinase A